MIVALPAYVSGISLSLSFLVAGGLLHQSSPGSSTVHMYFGLFVDGSLSHVVVVVVVVVVIAQQLFSYYRQLSRLRKSATAAGLSHRSCTVPRLSASLAMSWMP